MKITNRFFTKLLFCSLSVLFVLSLIGCGKQVRSSVSWFDMFDTVTVLVAYTDNEQEFSKQAAALKDELNEYHKLYDIYHTYPDMNNLKTINDNAGIAPVEVDRTIIDLILLGKELYTLTNGKTNIAMGSVLSLWHEAREFSSANPERAFLPDKAALEQALQHTDISQVIVDEEASTVFLQDPEMRLDVGSLGKGYAAEMAAQNAQKRGLDSALLSLGGNLRAIGQKPEGYWTGGIQNPWDNAANQSVFVVNLKDCSLVTSGDYQRFFEIDGVRYHHIIDPDTRMPSSGGIRSVSVRCADSGIADGLSTALFSMSVEDGLALIESLPDTEAVWLLEDESVRMSSGFESHCKSSDK